MAGFFVGRESARPSPPPQLVSLRQCSTDSDGFFTVNLDNDRRIQRHHTESDVAAGTTTSRVLDARRRQVFNR